MTSYADTPPRFRGEAASTRSKHVIAASIVSLIVALAVAGIVMPVAAVVYFAVGAGAGYALSGSV